MPKFKKILVTSDSSFSSFDTLTNVLTDIVTQIEPDSTKIDNEEPNLPIIFVRDRKIDNRLRNHIFINGLTNEHCKEEGEETKTTKCQLRVIQFMADWENDDNAGIQRNLSMFKSNISYVVICLSGHNETDNGLDHIEYLAFKHNIPLVIINPETITYMTDPESYLVRELENPVERNESSFGTIQRGSDEYKKKLESSVNIKRMYYASLKEEKTGVKMISKEEENDIRKKGKKKKKKISIKNKPLSSSSSSKTRLEVKKQKKINKDECFLKEEIYD